MNKPDYISRPDWELLTKKYSIKKISRYLKKNYPYQYLLKDVFFYNSLIKVNKNVLIPRWETEQLVDKIVKKLNFSVRNGLDLCTGSGCIAVSLSKELGVHFDAIDKSRKALRVAKKNVKSNDVSVSLIRQDLLKHKINGRYDLIVCNPPYVSYDEEVGVETKYEPQSAIFADNNGLIFYKTILKNLKNNLDERYLIAMEIGVNQKKDIIKIASNYFNKDYIKVEKDNNERDRFLFITNCE